MSGIQQAVAGLFPSAAPFFANGFNMFFNQADYNAYPNSSKTLGNAAALVTAGITDSGSINGTYFDSAGVMQVKTSGTAPRLNYVSGNLDSMLVEPAATNLALQNTQIGGTGWSTGNGASNSFSGTAPDGATTYSLITFAADVNSRIYDAMVTTTGSGVYTISVWAKAVSGTQTFRLGYYGNNTGILYYSSDFTATTTLQRFSATFTLGSTEVGAYPYVANGSSGAASTANLQAWGLQWESGSFATTTIITAASSVTRSQTVPLQPKANITGYAATGTWVGKAFTQHTASANQAMFSGDAAGAPQIHFFSSPSTILVQALSGVASLSNNSITTDTAAHTAAARFNAGNYAISSDGGAVTTNATATAPVAVTTNIKYGCGDGFLIGGVRRLAFSPTLASNAQLAQLSAGTL